MEETENEPQPVGRARRPQCRARRNRVPPSLLTTGSRSILRGTSAALLYSDGPPSRSRSWMGDGNARGRSQIHPGLAPFAGEA